LSEWLQFFSKTAIKVFENIIWDPQFKFHAILTSFEKVRGSGAAQKGFTLCAYHRLQGWAFSIKSVASPRQCKVLYIGAFLHDNNHAATRAKAAKLTMNNVL